MRKLYIFTLFMLFSLIAQDLFAQKTLRIRISQTFNNISAGCDGFVAGNPDWEWQFDTDGADPCIERDCNCSGAVVRDETLFGTNTYYSRNCWPTDNFNIGFRGFEDDGASNCDSECGIGYAYNARAYQPYNAANGDYTDWNNICMTTNCNCPANVQYCYTAQQVVGGSAFNATNLAADGYVNNTTCATARNLGIRHWYRSYWRLCYTMQRYLVLL